MAEAGRLTLVLDANLDALKQGLNDAGNYAAGYSKRTQTMLDGLKAKLDPVGAAAKRLSTEIATLDKFLEAGAITVAEHARAVDLARSAYERLEDKVRKTGVAEAAEITIARARLAVFEEGGAKIGIFGGALEALGPVGLGLAAVLAGVAITAEEAKKSLEYADDLDRTSKALGVSTTQLQEFDYATAGAAVGIAKGREALQSFNGVFGKYSAGLASAKSAKFLDALGFTPETALALGSTSEALEKVLTGLAKIQNPQQRAALATQLGLKDFLVVVAEGQEGVDKFVASIHEAQSAGAVISPDDVKRAAELNDKLDQLSHTTSVELKKVFIELGPILLGLAQLVDRIVGSTAQLVERLRGVSHLDRGAVGAASNDELGYRSLLYSSGLAGKVDAKTGRASGGLLSGAYNRHQDNLEQLNARRAELDKLDKEVDGSGAAVDLSKPAKTKATSAGTDYDKVASEAVAGANKALAEALANLATDVDERAAFEKQAVDAERDKTTAAIEAELRKLDADKSISASKKVELGFQLLLAEAVQESAATAKKLAIDRKAEEEIARRQLAYANDLATADEATLRAKASITRDANARADLELEAYRTAQTLALATKSLQLDQDKTKTPEERAAELVAFRGQQAAERTTERSSVLRQANPLYALANPLSSVNDDLQSITVTGLKGLNDELAKAVIGTESLGDAFHNITASILQDLAKLVIEKSIVEPLAGLLGGFFPGVTNIGNLAAVGGKISVGHNAAGTSFWSGGVSLVGENGPELLNLPRGSQITPNDRLIRGLANMDMPRAGDPGPISVNISLDGANGDEAVARIAEAAAYRGMAQAVAHTNARFAVVTKRQQNKLGTR